MDVATFRTYLNTEHRDKRLNEVLYPPLREESVRRIVEKCDDSVLSRIAAVADDQKCQKSEFFVNCLCYNIFQSSALKMGF